MVRPGWVDFFSTGQWPLLVDFAAAFELVLVLVRVRLRYWYSASQPLTDRQPNPRGEGAATQTFFSSRRCAAIRTHNTAAFSCRDTEWLFNGRPRTALWEEDHLAALLGEREREREREVR
jgi:hypothetical protein